MDNFIIKLKDAFYSNAAEAWQLCRQLGLLKTSSVLSQLSEKQLDQIGEMLAEITERINHTRNDERLCLTNEEFIFIKLTIKLQEFGIELMDNSDYVILYQLFAPQELQQGWGPKFEHFPLKNK